jgi:hypothetical protein
LPLGSPAGPFGCDGVSITVQFGELFHASTYRWWASGPPDWSPLVAWTERAWSWLDGPGVELEVSPSAIKDRDGKVVETIG